MGTARFGGRCTSNELALLRSAGEDTGRDRHLLAEESWFRSRLRRKGWPAKATAVMGS